MAVADTFEYLLGEWSLHRIIADHRSNARGTFAGTADVRVVDNGAQYEERGQLQYAGYDGNAGRTHEYHATENGTVLVNFSDGRPFFELDLRTGACRADHQCGEDLHELSFECHGTDLIREHWRVTGPSKDYSATTTWQRLL
jgi:hypothetical protein